MITFKDERKRSIPFSDVCLGQTFLYGDEVFIKISRVDVWFDYTSSATPKNAVNMIGVLYHVDDRTKVELVDIEVIIKEPTS